MGTGVKMSWAVLCTFSIGSRTLTLADSPDVKLVRSRVTLQVIVKSLVAPVMTNVLVTDPLLLLLLLDIMILSQLEPEQVHSMLGSPEPVAVQLKVALSN